MNPHRLLSTLALVLALSAIITSPTLPAAASPNLPAQCIIYVDVDAIGANNGATWADAYTSLSAALKPTSAGCQVWVAEGTYHPESYSRMGSFVLYNDVAVYGGFTGTEDALGERDWNLHPTILSGYNGGPADFYNVVYASGVNSSALLDGFTIQDGNANGTSTYVYAKRGGGIVIDNASPRLYDLTFKNNHADTAGGGVFITGVSSPSLRNVLIKGNTAYDGAGLYSEATGAGISLFTVYFADNVATHSGGGMYIYQTPVTSEWGRFDNNHADFGAGMVIDGTNNVTISQVMFFTNQATSKGGAAYFYNCYASLANALIAFNSAGYGGGIGGWKGHPTLSNVTFADNTATYGGAVYNSENSSPEIRNSILWSDDGGEVYNDPNPVYPNPSTAYFFNSLVQGCNPGGVWNAACGTNSGFNLADADPQFKYPSLGVYTLKITSPAINRGNSFFIAGFPYDLTGRPRISNFLVDLGAYELPISPLYLPVVKR